MRDLRSLPKGHLHLYRELGMRPATIAAFANPYGEPMPTVSGYGNFAAFSEICLAATGFLRTREDWERLADEICEDAANDGAVVVGTLFPLRRLVTTFW